MISVQEGDRTIFLLFVGEFDASLTDQFDLDGQWVCLFKYLQKKSHIYIKKLELSRIYFENRIYVTEK